MYFQCHVREVEDLDDAFALVVQDGTFVIVVRQGVIEPDDVELLDRLLKRGLAALLESPALAITA